MNRKIINIISIFLIVVFLMANFSYGIFIPHLYEYESDDGQKVIAYAELNAATIYLPSGKRIQSTNVNGGTGMNIDTITAPIEVILVIDVSGSMSGRRLEKAKQAAINLVENLFEVAEDIQISVISFSSSASVKIKKSDNQDSIKSAIRKLNAGGGTYILQGIERAEEIFSSLKSENEGLGINSFLINLTDGQDAYPEAAYNKLIEMQKKNIHIYNVLLESSHKEAFTGSRGEAGTIYTGVASGELTAIYDEIYNLICSEVVSSSVTDFTENAQNYFVANDDLYMFLDQEMLQGSKLEVEYVINIKSSIPCIKLELQDEVDKNLNFDLSSKLISEDKTNEECGWQVNENLSYKDGHNLVLSMTKLPEENSELVMKRGRGYQTKLVLSTLLTNQIEDMNYKNKLTFRINEDNNLAQSLEAMEVNIIPPFGEDKGYNKIWILILAGIIVSVGIITYRRS